VALGYAPGNQIAAPIDLPSAPPSANRPQHALLALVRVVMNLRDETDLQCLAFLAGELGILQNTPFCFSVALSQDSAVPESLVLRDTFETMLRQRMLGWDGGQLRALVDVDATSNEPSFMRERVSWLATLQPNERQALTRVIMQSHSSGASAARPATDGLLRGILSRVTGDDLREAVARRLTTACGQLVQA
jgi:hypothetical protein